MKIDKQKKILKIIELKRYRYDEVTGGIISNIGTHPSLMNPTKHVSGNVVYCLWSLDNERLMVYGQQFSWLATFGLMGEFDVIKHKDRNKTNNLIRNLCIPKTRDSKKTVVHVDRELKPILKKLTNDERLAIFNEWYSGRCKNKTELSRRFNVSRETVCRAIAKSYERINGPGSAKDRGGVNKTTLIYNKIDFKNNK